MGFRCGRGSRSRTWESTVDECARVIDQSGRPFQNIFAAGEIMSGNILTKGYLGGFGLTIGSVFGETGGQRGGDECQGLTSFRKPAASWSSATRAVTARDIAPCFARLRRAATSSRATFFIFQICATTAAPAITPACSRRRTNSRSIFRRFWRRRAWKRTAAGAGLRFWGAHSKIAA